MRPYDWSDDELDNVTWLTEEAWVPGADTGDVFQLRAQRTRPRDTVDRFPWELVAVLALLVFLAVLGSAIGGVR